MPNKRYYRAIENLYVDKLDENGFSTDESYLVPVGSIWELVPDTSYHVSDVHLEGVEGEENFLQWIEITTEHLEDYFEQMESVNEG